MSKPRPLAGTPSLQTFGDGYNPSAVPGDMRVSVVVPGAPTDPSVLFTAASQSAARDAGFGWLWTTALEGRRAGPVVRRFRRDLRALIKIPTTTRGTGDFVESALRFIALVDGHGLAECRLHVVTYLGVS